ncbi:hypothetical protein Strvi_4689 [Streptomyces violaceusniger Tu 4113]|uniref:Uncharacterized protein n=1 Tax=Streptomyces violaceusniger (strain Tu 4113) TaxID=653045 RepID=G2PFC5_STRV4|nr:hypothetical protein Strvi_4605 [Streptomyces violaceusniger Tu 4113]AEM84268.1 hypothetical protein Strvi_4689 [Streptomyces violaceusniger Tu 4113]
MLHLVTLGAESGEYGKIHTNWGLEYGAVTTAQIIRG